jgi:hypothetical protein
LQRSKGSYGKCFSKNKFRRNRDLGSKPMRVVVSLVNSHFGVQRFEGEKEFMSELENGEVTSGALVARWSQTSLNFFGVLWVGEPIAWHQDSRNH